MPSYNRPRDAAVAKLKAAAELEQPVKLSAEEAAILWKHIREEKWRHRPRNSLPIGNPYE